MKLTTKDMALVAMFTSLTAVGAFISIPLGPVPITLQTLFVILSGILLGPKLGALSQIVYIILGLIGIPIFAGFTGGPQSLLKPSFGFLIGFVFAAYLVGKIVHGSSNSQLKKTKSTNRRIWLGATVGTIVVYLFGLPYMYYILNIVLGKNLSFTAIMNLGCIAFLPGDALKLIFASVASTRAFPLLNKLESGAHI